jgi:hypothetical protein
MVPWPLIGVLGIGLLNVLNLHAVLTGVARGGRGRGGGDRLIGSVELPLGRIARDELVVTAIAIGQTAIQPRWWTQRRFRR